MGKKPFENIVGKGENGGYHNVSNPIKYKTHHFKDFYYVVCKCFQFGPQSNILSFGEEFKVGIVYGKRLFKFDENGRKLSKQVEKTVRKGEIARYEQFLLFPQCFQKACFPGVSKGVIVWEWAKWKVRKVNQEVCGNVMDKFIMCVRQGKLLTGRHLENVINY